jgi:L-alanine-DL-glutamate epimerase-like enolase superfamily enzyme
VNIDEVRAAAYTVPTPGPEADGTLCWDAVTLVVVTARAGDTIGTGWSYGHAGAVPVVNDVLAGAVKGRDVMAVPQCYAAMRMAARNDLVPGLVGIGLSAVDVALWDLKARLLDVSLTDLFGRARDTVPVYGSGGFTTWTDEETAERLGELVHGAEGIRAVKIKIAEEWGANERRDLHRIEVVREAVGTGCALMVDANGGYQVKQAARVAREAGGVGVIWFEEPVSSDHLADLALLRGIIEPEVAAGEYGTDPWYFRRMCEAGAVDCLQIDATRAGGYTGFRAAAAIADSFGLQVSAHCAPSLHFPVCASTPNLRHVEWFFDHRRAEPLLFHGAARVRGGVLESDARPGHGVALRGDAERFRVL